MCKIISFPFSCKVSLLHIFSMNSNVSIELVGVSLLNWVNIHGDDYCN